MFNVVLPKSILVISCMSKEHKMNTFMKYYETRFEDYLSVTTTNTDNHEDLLQHTILYGPSGTGKYTRALQLIAPHSPTHLTIDRKMYVSQDKDKYVHCIRFSDVHFEVDIGMLGHSSRAAWQEIYDAIVQQWMSRSQDSKCIILCKNMHTISAELLAIFHTYMSPSYTFVFTTEQISFLPGNCLCYCWHH